MARESDVLEFSGLVKEMTGNELVNRATHRGPAGDGRERGNRMRREKTYRY